MGFIDGTVVPIAMPAIRSTLGATLNQATWINNAYMVTLASLILTGGAFGDRFGLGRVFSIGILLFMASSLFCTVAPNPDALILARLAQGAGAALMIPGSLAMISRAYPRDIRGRAIGMWAAGSAVTTAAGPIVGGLMLSLGGPEMWRWIFGINLPLGLVALVLVRYGIKQDARRPDQPVDIVGAALAAAGLGGLAWTLTRLEGRDTGIDTLLIGVAGAVAIVLFFAQEHRTRYPMMPLDLFRNGTFSAANAATFALYFGMSAILFSFRCWSSQAGVSPRSRPPSPLRRCQPLSLCYPPDLAAPPTGSGPAVSFRRVRHWWPSAMPFWLSSFQARTTGSGSFPR